MDISTPFKPFKPRPNLFSVIVYSILDLEQKKIIDTDNNEEEEDEEEDLFTTSGVTFESLHKFINDNWSDDTSHSSKNIHLKISNELEKRTQIGQLAYEKKNKTYSLNFAVLHETTSKKRKRVNNTNNDNNDDMDTHQKKKKGKATSTATPTTPTTPTVTPTITPTTTTNSNNDKTKKMLGSNIPITPSSTKSSASDFALPEGWSVIETVRKTGASQGKIDKCWEAPNGQKFRSKLAVTKYLKANPPSKSKKRQSKNLGNNSTTTKPPSTQTTTNTKSPSTTLNSPSASKNLVSKKIIIDSSSAEDSFEESIRKPDQESLAKIVFFPHSSESDVDDNLFLSIYTEEED